MTNCQLCGERPATAIVKNKINNKTLHICEECKKWLSDIKANDIKK